MSLCDYLVAIEERDRALRSVVAWTGEMARAADGARQELRSEPGRAVIVSGRTVRLLENGQIEVTG